MAAEHADERFIPPRQKMDQLSVVKDYSAIPRLEYRYVFFLILFDDYFIYVFVGGMFILPN